MKRAPLLVLAVVLPACGDSNADRPPRTPLLNVHGVDTTYADARLAGYCVRGADGQPMGQIVGVTEDGFGGQPGYRIAVPGGKGRVLTGTAGIKDRLMPCP